LLVGIRESDTLPQVRILDPNPGKQTVIKYAYAGSPELSRDEIYSFA